MRQHYGVFSCTSMLCLFALASCDILHAHQAHDTAGPCCAGVIAAAALKCMGGSMQGRLYPRNDEERTKAHELGYDVTRILYADDLCAGEQVPHGPATGLTQCIVQEGPLRFLLGGF